MNVDTNHLVNVTDRTGVPAGYDLLPESLNRAAKRKLNGKDNAYVSKTSGGKLSRWAAKMGKTKLTVKGKI